MVFHAIELAAREVTNCTPHVRKPSSSEKKLTLLLNSDRNAPDFAQNCERLVAQVHEAHLARATKRVHASLVSGRGMKKALAAHFHATTPPIALMDDAKKMPTSPHESCSIMSKALSQLGGGMDYSVPADVEAEFLQEVHNNPPSKSFSPPTWDQFQSIIRRPKPTKSDGA